MSTQARLTVQSDVARLTFENAAGLNLLDANCRAEVTAALLRLREERNVRVLVISAVGRVFLAGADVEEMRSLNPMGAIHYAEMGQQLMNRLEDLPQVTIAAIHGTCLGGGCELSLACDWRVLASGARIGLPEVRLGLIPGWGGTYRAVRNLGLTRAQQLVLRGEPLTAAEAHAVGLAQQVVSEAELTNAVETLVKDLLTRGPDGLRWAKQTLLAHAAGDRTDALRREALAFAACFENGQPHEGVTAFREKRAPRWS